MADRFWVWAFCDDEERSGTYIERVGRCQGCGGWLDTDVLFAAREEERSGLVDYSQAASDELPRTPLLDIRAETEVR